MATRQRATYKSFAESTPEDWAIQASYAEENADRLTNSLLDMLKRLKDKDDGSPISTYNHSLQSATRAHEDGADDETVFIALLHDVSQDISEENHSEVAATILHPYISDRAHWIVKHHGIFQGYYFWHYMGKDRNAREVYRDHPYFDACIEWCDKYDQNAFDAEYPSKPLEFFEPLVRRIMSREPWSLAGC